MSKMKVEKSNLARDAKIIIKSQWTERSYDTLRAMAVVAHENIVNEIAQVSILFLVGKGGDLDVSINYASAIVPNDESHKEPVRREIALLALVSLLDFLGIREEM